MRYAARPIVLVRAACPLLPPLSVLCRSSVGPLWMLFGLRQQLAGMELRFELPRSIRCGHIEVFCYIRVAAGMAVDAGQADNDQNILVQ